MAKYIVSAYRIREILDVDSPDSMHEITSFLIEDGPDGSDDVKVRSSGNPVMVGDYWVNPFGHGRIIPKDEFERTYTPVKEF